MCGKCGNKGQIMYNHDILAADDDDTAAPNYTDLQSTDESLSGAESAHNSP